MGEGSEKEEMTLELGCERQGLHQTSAYMPCGVQDLNMEK